MQILALQTSFRFHSKFAKRVTENVTKLFHRNGRQPISSKLCNSQICSLSWKLLTFICFDCSMSCGRVRKSLHCGRPVNIVNTKNNILLFLAINQVRVLFANRNVLLLLQISY